ncbi:folylpolyglutamate synthase, mitochondrial-like isoform X2 [Chrysoperla carnea]|nr:folylpolyglutamate synthase, mitochondrial-like isoform X2 [Chrysoperla carnea]XP_044728350.1 folylpolyglutamate synthase, mitochondrial-like isoform X2 [Chrysoperla carnea]
MHRQRENDCSKYCLRSGINFDQLDTLPVIHIAGTKGKGTTSAFCESILRQHGYKTGFFSSPHLISVRERIRLNGKPIDKIDFIKYFWSVHEKLENNKENETDMPPYFQFLTILAFNIFLSEKVDVAVVEVGIGGEYDCTNILRKVPVVGITSLGMDHTSLLGNTIEEIAWQKSGIMKPDCKAFTVPQASNALKVLQNRSIEKNCSLQIVPDFNEYEFETNMKQLQNKLTDVQQINASLAIQLSYAFMNIDSSKINEKTVQGLLNCRWPGRTQILDTSMARFFLDGAHTIESLAKCIEWFTKQIGVSDNENILIFNVTGDRDSQQLLKLLNNVNFKNVIFVPNNAYAQDDNHLDQVNYNSPTNLQLKRCEDHKKIWENINKNKSIVNVYPSVSHALEMLKLHEKKPNVLVTGSLHLIGAVLKLIDPDLRLSTTVENEVQNIS